ncbi:DUF4440 domain-containing protein [Streptomyces tsukubensis]|uniref:DUF4440 domain-containing protein n=1 Tax=Streptomyces tsukubensis TaxID=83656 RepID=A0A1V4ABB8_9ACTN|nr:DUF4440 domain-containing protein [Streptomyces tsukubensis]
MAEVIAGELRLLRPEVRCVPELFAALLHPEFREIGASGRIWDRAAVVFELGPEASPDDPAATASGLRAVRIGDDLIQLRFDTDNNGRRAHRSSLWRRTGGRWLLWFHQGTLFTDSTGGERPAP